MKPDGAPRRVPVAGPFGFGLTVDVEEWYHTCLVPEYVHPDRRPAGLARELDRLLPELCELLAAAGRSATFFVLGEVARQLPRRVAEVAAAGHELGCHGLFHLRVGERPPAAFAAEARDAKALIEDVAGARVRGFRAPEWSFRRPENPRLRLLAEAGYLYDSSLAPFPGAGRLGNPRRPVRLRWAAPPGGPELLEVPPLTFGGMLPAGSWTGRLAPPEWVIRAARTSQARGGLPVLVIHPWEISGRPTPGRLAGLARFIHETGRLAYRRRFGELLRTLPWRPLWSAFGSPAAPRPVLPSPLMSDVAALKDRIKRTLVERLQLEMEPAAIGDALPLFGEGLGLDSVDALELVLGLEQEFGIKIEDEELDGQSLASVDALADFLISRQAAAS